MGTQDARRVVLETTATRDKAEALLEALRRARRESCEQMKALGIADKMQEATGRSLYDNAIEATRRMVDALNRCVRDAKRDLDLDRQFDDLSTDERDELLALDAEIFGGEPAAHAEPATSIRRPDRAGAPAAP